MNSIKLSIIVPVHNSEKTLAACLGNLIFQTLEEIEIIIVNDNSTDNSLKIITDCKNQFPQKVSILNSHTTRGAGGARNLGIHAAKGDYIGFVDSDDIVDPSMFQKLYQKAIDEDFDIVDCGFYNEETDNAILYTGDDLTGTLDSHKRSVLIASGGYIWSKIFKTSLIKNSDFLFRENVILEDCDWLINAFNKAYNIGNIKEILYIYKNYNDSLSKKTPSEEYYNNCISTVEAVYNKTSHIMDQEIKSACEYAMLQLISYSLNVSVSLNKNQWIQNIKSLYKKVITIPVNENTFSIAKIKPENMDVLNKYIINSL